MMARNRIWSTFARASNRKASENYALHTDSYTFAFQVRSSLKERIINITVQYRWLRVYFNGNCSLCLIYVVHFLNIHGIILRDVYL